MIFFFFLSFLQSLLYYGMAHAHLQKQRDEGAMSAVIQQLAKKNN
jgi:hypothetical protein